MDCRIVLDLARLKHWIEHEAGDVDAVSITGMPLLHCAVFYRHVEVVQYLVAMSVQINAIDKSGNTAVHLAVSHDWPDMVQYLLECQASPNIPNSLGQTPLHLAVQKNSLPIVSKLLQFHADVNRADTDGTTPIFQVKDRTIFEQLIQASASLNHQNELGQTPIMILLHRYITTKLPVYRDMFEWGITRDEINWSLVDTMGRSIYHHAVICRHPKLLELIITRSSSSSSSSSTLTKLLKVRDRRGETCLDLARRLGYVKASAVITKIIDHSTNPLTHDK
jgi:ankyrin repeat protein